MHWLDRGLRPKLRRKDGISNRPSPLHCSSYLFNQHFFPCISFRQKVSVAMEESDPTVYESVRATAEQPEPKRRKVRKGTQSCWECKRRKVRCTFSEPAEESVCDGCKRRG